MNSSIPVSDKYSAVIKLLCSVSTYLLE